MTDDYFSELPECVLHRVMSFLSEQDLSRIAVVSRWLHHVWVTSPITDIELPSSAEGMHNHLKLIDLALSREIRRLEKRRFCTSMCLQKLRVHAMFRSIDGYSKINHLFYLAVQNRVEEIDFCDIECLDFIRGLCKLWTDSFFVTSIRVVKIKRFELQDWYLDLVAAQTEELILDQCSGLEIIHISKDNRLKVVDIQCCRELRMISFESSASLQSLTLRGNIEDVTLKDCRSLKDLTLEFSQVNDASLAHILSQCPVLEALSLTTCRFVRTISFKSPTLKKIDVIKCRRLQRIQISAKSLQSFKFEMGKQQDCEIDIKQCESIRHVRLHHSNIEDKWVEENLWKFYWLEDLSIERCCSLKKLILPNERIKNLGLHSCPLLEEVEISSPLLECYEFSSAFFPRHSFLRSYRVRATLLLRVICQDLHEFKSFRDFLVGFHLCEELTLTCGSIQDWHFPKSWRETTTYPMYTLKHLRITAFENPTKWVDLMSNLLWFAPRPKKISILYDSREIMSVEFQYSRIAIERDDQHCCRCLPLKCWKHYLIEMRLRNLEVDKRTRPLLDYFIENAPTLRKIHTDSNCFQVFEGKLDNQA